MQVRTISFTVPAVPVAQPRQRHRIAGNEDRHWVQNYTPSKAPVNDFKATLRMVLRQTYKGPPLEGPLGLSVVFVFPRPSRLIWKKKPMLRVEHIGKPDMDNLVKAVKDAMKKIAYRDDSQVCKYLEPFDKVYAAGNEQPHVEVTLKAIGTTP